LSLVKAARNLLVNCMGLEKSECLLVVGDPSTAAISRALVDAGRELGAEAVLVEMARRGHSGEEPPPAVAAAMAAAQVVICPTATSLTHTRARVEACRAGARVATMPGITEDMFFEGAVRADYQEVARLTAAVTDILSAGRIARLVKHGHELVMSLEGRQAVASTGVYRRPGESGNLPSGEAYIAPLEGSAHGRMLVDGSIAGIGLVTGPLAITFRDGHAVGFEGPDAPRLQAMLAGKPLATNLAELGVGTNPEARLRGVVLEDEKIYGTVHLALGDNAGFGGNTRAGIHIDLVITGADLYVDDRPLVLQGSLQI